MEYVLREFPNADPYVDDVIIGSVGKTEAELMANHDRDVRNVLAALREHKLVCSPKKSLFFMRTVEFCGHVLREGRREPASGKLQALQKWELPRTITELRGFLGLANYYSCYVPKYADLAAPLQERLKVGREEGKKGRKNV